jgi:hypothetical protein
MVRNLGTHVDGGRSTYILFLWTAFHMCFMNYLTNLVQVNENIPD